MMDVSLPYPSVTIPARLRPGCILSRLENQILNLVLHLMQRSRASFPGWCTLQAHRVVSNSVCLQQHPGISEAVDKIVGVILQSSSSSTTTVLAVLAHSCFLIGVARVGA